jgi:hypothetical protein
LSSGDEGNNGPKALEQLLSTLLQKQQEHHEVLLAQQQEKFEALLRYGVGGNGSARRSMDEPERRKGSSMDSLLKRMSTFSYDPDNKLTFDLWYSRYEDTIVTGGADLDDAAKVRLVIQKLDQSAFQKYAAHILPLKFAEITFEQSIETLRNLFGHQGLIFARSYKFLQTSCSDLNSGSFDDYTGLVNKRFEMADMGKINANQMKCLIWICGLKDPKFEKVRNLSLQFVEKNQDASLQDLHQFAKNFSRLEATSKDIAGGRSSLVEEVNRKPFRGCRPKDPTPSGPCKNDVGNLTQRLAARQKSTTAISAGNLAIRKPFVLPRKRRSPSQVQGGMVNTERGNVTIRLLVASVVDRTKLVPMDLVPRECMWM